LPDAGYRAVDHARELVPINFAPAFAQALPRILNRKPGAVSVGFFRMAKPQYFTEMSVDCEFFPRGSGRRFSVGISTVPNIASERNFFDPSMHARFLESLKRRNLGMGQPRLSLALREGPAPATPRPNATSRLDQEKLDAAIAYAVANRGRLLAVLQFLQLRQPNETSRPSMCSNRRQDMSRAPNSRISQTCTHRNRVHRAICLCIEHSLILASSKAWHCLR
jgi:hypothetical protein